MRASCRNAPAVVTECAADYHSRMPATESHRYRLVEHTGPGRRVRWLGNDRDARVMIVASGYEGAEATGGTHRATLRIPWCRRLADCKP
jgi:hypothetical protein